MFLLPIDYKGENTHNLVLKINIKKRKKNDLVLTKY